MAATSTVIEQNIELDDTKRMYLLAVTLTNSYNAGGETIDATGNERFDRLSFGSASGYSFEFIPSSQKLKIYRQKDPGNAGGADIPLPEVTAGVDLSTTPGTIYGWGIGA